MSLLTLLNKFTQRTLAKDTTLVLGSGDNQIIQIASILEEEGNDLAQRHNWQSLQKESTFITIANEDQGAIDSLATGGFRFIRNGTIWNRSNKLPVYGPIGSREWQARKAAANTGPRYNFRFRGNHLLINPAPSAGLTFAFEYQSNNWILDVDGVTTKSGFTADTDTFLLDETLLLMGIRWRWLKEKGLDYAELYNTYEVQVKDAIARDGGADTLYADNDTRSGSPAVYIPAGSWALP